MDMEFEERPEDIVLFSGKDGRCPGAWWRYREGIPRESSVDHQNLMQEYGDEEAIPVLGVGDN
jgi:hypothetical protein